MVPQYRSLGFHQCLKIDTVRNVTFQYRQSLHRTSLSPDKNQCYDIIYYRALLESVMPLYSTHYC